MRTIYKNTAHIFAEPHYKAYLYLLFKIKRYK